MRRMALIVGLLAVGGSALAATDGSSGIVADEALKAKVDHYVAAGSLKSVLIDFALSARVIVRVDWSALEKTGVTETTRVSIDVEKVNYKQALEVILAKVSRTGQPLGWRTDGSDVLISTHRRILQMGEATGRVIRRIAPEASPAQSAARKTVGVPKQSPGINFDRLPFKDALDFFKTILGTNIHINWRAMETEGIDPQTPITLNVRKIAVGRALDLVLDQVNAGRSKFESVYWVVDGGVLMITTGNDLNRKVVTRVIDAAGVLALTPDFTGPRIDLNEQVSPAVDASGFGSGSGAGAGIFEEDTTSRRSQEKSLEEQKKERREAIIKTIKSMIGQDMWQEEGKGSIQLIGNNLVISQTLLGFKLLESALR